MGFISLLDIPFICQPHQIGIEKCISQNQVEQMVMFDCQLPGLYLPVIAGCGKKTFS